MSTAYCNCPARNTKGRCPHYAYLRQTTEEVVADPVVDGWYTRLAWQSQGCSAWRPIPGTERWVQCLTWQNDHASHGADLVPYLEDECINTIQAITDDDPYGHIVETDIESFCPHCASGHGKKTATVTEWIPKKKGDRDDGHSSKSSRYRKGKTTRLVYTGKT